MRGVVSASVVAVVLALSGCTFNQQQAANTPEATPSTPAVTTTPSTAPTPTDTPTPETSPTSAASPSTARLIITSLTFHAGEVAVAYAPVALNAAGGKPPYHWSISSGALPAGIAVGGSHVSGTPSASGTFSFTVRVDDSAGGAAGIGRSITVARHLTASGTCATQACSVEKGCTSVCGAFGSQFGGVGPFSYKVTAGKLPPSTSLNGLSLAGTFTLASKYFFAVSVTDSLSVVASISANFSVFPHIAFTVSRPTCVGYGCTVQVPYTMGTPNSTPALTITNVVCPTNLTTFPPTCDGTPPAPLPNHLPSKGFIKGIGGGVVTFTFLSPGTYGNWLGTFNAVITDQSLCGPGGVHCSATVTVTVDNNTRYG